MEGKPREVQLVLEPGIGGVSAQFARSKNTFAGSTAPYQSQDMAAFFPDWFSSVSLKREDVTVWQQWKKSLLGMGSGAVLAAFRAVQISRFVSVGAYVCVLRAKDHWEKRRARI